MQGAKGDEDILLSEEYKELIKLLTYIDNTI
jgi:hypothetical protein